MRPKDLPPLPPPEPIYTPFYFAGRERFPLVKGSFWGSLLGVVLWGLLIMVCCGGCAS